MMLLKKQALMLLAASSLAVPTPGLAQDSATLLTQAAGSFRLVDEAMTAAVSSAPQAEAVTEADVTAKTPAAAQPGELDLAALYYYAQQRQDERVAAEAGRLRLKFPGFEMPQDLFVPQAERSVDETLLWQLFDKNDFTAIDAEIIRRQSETPDWVPTSDFSEKLARKKQRVLMTEAAKAKNWTAVIQAAGSLDPATETEMDLLWTLIDAYAEMGLKQPLADAYRGILLREGDKRLPDAVLVTTLQKAVRDFPASEVQAVIEKLAVTPAMQVALRPVAFDLLRKTVADFNADDRKTEPLSQDQITPLENAEVPSAETMGLLGWYYLKIKQPAVSNRWFAKALAVKADASNAKGLYLSLAAQNLEQQAYEVAATHLEDLTSDPEFLMNALSLRFAKPDATVIDDKIVASYSTTILQTLNADHAEILAWYAYNSRQYAASSAWFRKSIDWKPAPARVKGLALSYLRLSQKADFEALHVKYAAAYPDIWAEIKAASPPKGRKAAPVVKPGGGVEANYLRNFQAKRYGACINDLNDLQARGQVSAGAAEIGGWCYLGLGRLSEARAAFAAGLNAGGQARSDAAYGTALTLLRGHLTDDTEAMLSAYPLSPERDREIRAEIYVQRARAAFDQKRYQNTLDALNARASLIAEPADLSQLRGWAYYHLGNKTMAKQVFERLNDHLSDAGVRRGLMVTSQMDTRR